MAALRGRLGDMATSSRPRRKSQGGGGPAAKAAKIEDYMSHKSDASQPVLLLRAFLPDTQGPGPSWEIPGATFVLDFRGRKKPVRIMTCMRTLQPNSQHRPGNMCVSAPNKFTTY